MPGRHSFKIVRPEEWLQQLESALSGSQAEHQSQALLGLWKSKDAHKKSVTEGVDEYRGSNTRQPPEFVITSSSRLSQTMRNIKPLNRNRVEERRDWIGTNVGITAV